MNVIRMIFAPDPKPQEKYILDDGDPFYPHYAEIVEIKNGWVKFNRVWLGAGGIDRETISDFKLFWRRISEEEFRGR